MSRPGEGPVAFGFEAGCIRLPIATLLPVKALRSTVKMSAKYQQIAASIREIGLVEPPVVARSGGGFLILDGHIRIEILKDLGEGEVECLVSTDDEAFTYNKRISRLSAVQEHAMIVRAIARERPDATVLALTPNRATARRLSLVWGIHPVPTKDASDIDDMAARACKFAVREGFAKIGERITVVAGVPFGMPGATNMVRIAYVTKEHAAKA